MLFSLICSLAERHPDAKWFFFANEETQVDFETLSVVLNRYNENEVSFLFSLACNWQLVSMYGLLWYRFGFLVMH